MADYGTQASFVEDLPPQQAAGNPYGDSASFVDEKTSAPGLLARISADRQKRLQEAKGVADKVASGQMSSTAGKIIMADKLGVAQITDPIKEVISGAGSAIGSVIPEKFKKAGVSTTGALANTAVGRASEKAIGRVGEDISNLQQKYPVTSQLVGAGLDIASVIPAIKPAARGIESLEGGTGIVKNIAKSTADNAKLFAEGVMSHSPDKLQTISDELYKGAQGTYEKMKQAGAVFNENRGAQLKDSIDAALKENPFIPQLNPKTTAIVNHLKEAIDTNKGIDLNSLDQYRRLLSRTRDEDGVASVAVRKAIDNIVNSSTSADLVNGSKEGIDLLNQARKGYHVASKFDDIADIVARANGNPTKLKTYLNTFLSKEKNIKGFTPQELDLLKKAASYGNVEGATKMVGNLGVDFQNPSQGIVPALEGVAAVYRKPGAIPALGLGTISKHVSKNITKGKLQRATDEILKGLKP